MVLRDFGKTAVIHRDRKVLYGDLIHLSRAFSHRLTIPRGGRVLLCAENRPEWISALFAIWDRGGTAIPIDALSRPADLVHFLQDSRPEMIIASRETEEKVRRALVEAGSKAGLVLLEDQGPKGPAPPSPTVKRDPSEVAAILYTSGTTGRPKGVMLTFANLYSNISGIEEARIASSKDVLLSFLPFHHSYPLMVTLLLPLHLGAAIVLVDRPASDEILRCMKEYGVTILVGVPRFFEALHRSIMERIQAYMPMALAYRLCRSTGSTALGRAVFAPIRRRLGRSIKYFVSGGAKLDEAIIRDLLILGLPVIEGYGLTETAPICTFNPPGRIRIGSAGLPLSGVTLSIEDGEILVKGPNVMSGYLGLEKETREALKNGWFHTGDLGYVDEDGYLFIIGRKKDIIVLASGKNVNPEEVENEIVRTSDLVREVAVIERKGRLHALILPDFEAMKALRVVNLEEKLKWDVVDRYNREAPAFRKLAGFEIVREEFPKTRLGKIKRHLLTARVEQPEQEGKIEEAGETFRILSDYLMSTGHGPIRPDSHLEIDLGLDSLDKVELLHFIEKSFGLSLDETALSRLLVFNDLISHIDRAKSRVAETRTGGWSEVLAEGVSLDLASSQAPIQALRGVLRILFRTYFRVTISGTECIPPSPCIFAPNHQSYLDGFLVLGSLPPARLDSTYFLANELYFRGSFKKRIARAFHVVTIDVDRNLAVSLKTAATLLRQGKDIVIFPEGARSRDGSLLPFKKAFAILARELGAPVMPIAISGAYEIYSFRRAFPRPGRIRVRFLDPLFPDTWTVEEIASRTRDAILTAMEKGKQAGL